MQTISKSIFLNGRIEDSAQSLVSQIYFERIVQPQSLDLISKYFYPSTDQLQMAEEPKRNSMRTKKIPSYLRMDDSQYGHYSGNRNIDTKENKSNPQDLNQTAKMLMKFINASNHRAKLIDKDDMLELPIYDKNSSGASRYKTDFQGQKIPMASFGNSQVLNTSNKNQRDKGNLSNGPNKATSKNNSKKELSIKNEMLGLSNTIQSDLSYHKVLERHIKSTLQDQKDLSAQSLMKLPPREQFYQAKVKNGDRKKSELLGVSKSAKAKEQLKPFKRQSYHVAVAYHIYLKDVRSVPNLNPNYIDPTYKARKLKQQTMKQ